MERDVLEVHALLVAVFVLLELVLDAAMIHEAVGSLVTLLLEVSADRLRNPRPHASPVVFGTQLVQLFGLELQLLLLKVLQGALAFPILPFGFLGLDLLEVFGVLLSRLFGRLGYIEVPPRELLNSGLVLRMQLISLLFGLLAEGVFALFELLLLVIELLPHPFVVGHLQLHTLLLDLDEPVDLVLFLLHRMVQLIRIGSREEGVEFRLRRTACLLSARIGRAEESKTAGSFGVPMGRGEGFLV